MAAVAGFTRHGIAEHGCFDERGYLHIASGHLGVGGLSLNKRHRSRGPQDDQHTQRSGEIDRGHDQTRVQDAIFGLQLQRTRDGQLVDGDERKQNKQRSSDRAAL
jgi:hypothetical protein